MKKILWTLIAITALFAFYTAVFHPDWIIYPPFQNTYAFSSPDKGDPNQQLNPNRPYFNACGDEYDAQGQLMQAGSGCLVTTPTVTSNTLMGK